MTIRTFWTLFLKILGIWLVLSGLTVIPQFISAFTFFGDNPQENLLVAILVIVLMLLTLALYFVVLKLLVFNSDRVIDKLKLDKGFREEKLDLAISLKTVLTIATIVIGGLIFVDALPMLGKHLFTLIQKKALFVENPQVSWIIFYAVKALIGYLLMTNSQGIVGFINRKTANVDQL